MDTVKTKTRTISENSLKNLRPAQKGEVRNPLGRPLKEDCLLSCIKEELLHTAPGSPATNEQLIAFVLVKKATEGDIHAIDLMMSYLHSKPSQGIDVNAKVDVSWTVGKGYDSSKT